MEVYISGAAHTPSAPNEMYRQVKNFYADLPEKDAANAIKLAAWTHAEFVRIHPFTDGNGRTSRLIMN
ncbi:Fic family protein [Paenibacillus zanthoxyli]|uniref:Fic family protein n=1 Tax=Paenibacillus zanthoxyli TaxID=369399 RepID=UPI0018DB5C40|nr:Fic family protein [Paenibacillus zanthoxyli]